MSLKDELAKEPNDADLRRIRDLERQLARSTSELTAVKARHDQAEKDLADAEKKVELFTATAGSFEQQALKWKSPKPGGQATALINATDWHVEERIDPRTINGLNEYTLDIANRRITKLWEKAVYLTEASRSISKIRNCVLALLGDFITGYIHDELLESNFLSPTRAILFAQERIASGINYLLKHGKFDLIEIPCVVGNHGRTAQKQRIATRIDNNYEWIAYQNLAQQFAKERRVRFVIAEGYHQWLTIQGWKCRFHHGDGLRYQGGVGGLSIPVNKAIAQWNKSQRADFDFFGHWHQFLWHKNWVSCPCLIGYNAWAQWIKAEMEEPAQAFGVIDRERGLCDMKPIYVEAPRVAA
jgi:hypothetical protein